MKTNWRSKIWILVLSLVINACGSKSATTSAVPGQTAPVETTPVGTPPVATLPPGQTNAAPTMSAISSPQITAEDTSKDVPFTVGDANGALNCTSANLLYTSTNASIVAASGAVAWSGAWPNCVGTIAPVANANGSSDVTFTISDGALAASRTFSLSVTPANDAPTISDVSNQSTDQDTALNNISVAIADLDNALTCASISKSSSNQTLLPDSNITISGSGTSCAVNVNPAASQSGTATVTLTVTDGTITASDTFTLTVIATDTAPVANTTTTSDLVSGTLASVSLGYTDAENNKATACAVSGLSRVTESAACSCDGSGNCSVGLSAESSFSGSGSFSYTVTANGKTSNSSTVAFNIILVVAEKLAFLVEPSNTTTGQTIIPAVKVKLQTASGINTPFSGVSVTLQLSTTPPGVSLSGTLSATTVNGVATFSNLSISGTASGLIFLAQSSGLTSALSDSFTISSLPPAIIDAVTPGATATTPSITVSSVATGNTVEVLQGSNSACVGGFVVGSTLAGGSSATVSTTVIGGAAPAELWVRVTDANGNVSCSYGGVTSTPAAGTAFYPPDSGSSTLALANHACTIVNTTLYCWGGNYENQLGDGTLVASFIPKPVVGMNSGISAVSVSDTSTCVIKSGAVYCWGDNWYHQTDISYNGGANISTPTVHFSLNSNVSAISLGGTTTNIFACAVQNGAVFCWGYNSNNQVHSGGNCSGGGSYCSMKASALNTGVTAVSAGSNFACAIQDLGGTIGSLYCWGGNASSQLGDNTVTQRAAPALVGGTLTSGWTAVSADPAGSSVCALNGGKVYCWGLNTSGQLGLGHTTLAAIPTLVPDTADFTNASVTSLFVRNQKACAIKNAALYCWGLNSSGEMHDGTTTNALSPKLVPGFSTGVSAVAVGNSGICAVQSGTLKCWGSSRFGELGTGAVVASPAANLTQPGQNLVGAVTNQLALNDKEICAVQNGLIKCVGANANGEFGNGTVGASVSPVIASGIGAPIAWIRKTSTNVFALTTTGELWSWGQNSSGTLGVGNTTTPQSTPTKILGGGGTTVTQAVVAPEGGCAVAGGGLYCWGTNARGAVGNGTTTAVTAPYEVFAAGSGVTHVTMPFRADTASYTMTSVCAIKNGELFCWGDNTQGQLGNGVANGTAVTTATSRPVGGVTTGVTAVKIMTNTHSGTTYTSTCAIQNGALYCWGSNALGLLGNGTVINTYTTTTPVQSLTANVSSFEFHSYQNIIRQICAIMDGELWCWGSNVTGSVGNGNATTPITAPEKVLDKTADAYGNTDVTKVLVGRTSCALKGSGLYCWGLNAQGAVGNGNTTNQLSPTLALGLQTGVSDFTTPGGETNTYASRTWFAIKNGALFSWGNNTNAILGQAGVSTTSTPTEIFAKVVDRCVA